MSPYGYASTATPNFAQAVHWAEHPLPWVGFAVKRIFALANAGITIHDGDFGHPVAVAIIVALVLGKPVGVVAFSWLAVRSGMAVLGPTLSWPYVAAGAILTGIGFTMSLFIAGLAFEPAILNAAKLGILSASTLAAVIGSLVLVQLSWRGARVKDIASMRSLLSA